MSEGLATVEQAAEQLKLHPKTVLRFIRAGRLRATRIGKSYRILQSDLNAFAGMAAQAEAARTARVTSVIEVSSADTDLAQRLSSLLNAATMDREARADAIQLTTAFDQNARSLKVVVIGTPLDTAQLLKLVHLQLENLQ
jgi:excisionase family DNA binding protein